MTPVQGCRQSSSRLVLKAAPKDVDGTTKQEFLLPEIYTYLSLTLILQIYIQFPPPPMAAVQKVVLHLLAQG